MKKWIIAIVLIHAVYLFPFLKPGIPLSHDGDGHLARIAAVTSAIRDGQMPPRWAADLNFRFGTPVFIFNYQLPYYIAVFLHMIGLNLADSFKLILSISFVLSGVGFFLWLSQIVRKEVAFIGAMLFGLSPYHFLNVFVRGAFGETVALAIIPFIFWQIEKIIKRNKLSDILVAGILYGLLILSHNGSAIIFSPVFILYFLFRMKNRYHLISLFAFFFIGLLISAYFWLPAVLESKYVIGVKAFEDMYRQHFPSFVKLIYSDWELGANVNSKSGLSPQVGIVIFIFVVVAVINFVKTCLKSSAWVERDSSTSSVRWRTSLGMTIFWLIVFSMSVFLTISLSDLIWSNITLLRLLEFPWRFTALSVLAGAVIASLVISEIRNKKLVYFIVLVLLVNSFFYTKTNMQNKKDDNYYYSYTGSTVYRSATSTVWTGQDPFEIPKNKIEIISGDGEINNLLVRSNVHLFTLNANSDVRVLDNTFYFPGWRVRADGKKVPIKFQDINHRGLITFLAPKGTHNIEVVFEESIIRLFSNMISLFSLLVMALFFTIKLFHMFHFRRL